VFRGFRCSSVAAPRWSARALICTSDPWPRHVAEALCAEKCDALPVGRLLKDSDKLGSVIAVSYALLLGAAVL